jgi:hypothetical protein
MVLQWVFLPIYGVSGDIKMAGAGTDPFYDCPLRQLAKEYTCQVVLQPWMSQKRSKNALSLVSEGLRLDQCNMSLPVASNNQHLVAKEFPAASTVLYVATDGNDSAQGTQASPLKTLTGAQMKIRQLFPSIASRPAISVLVEPGDYFFGPAGPEHLAMGTSYSGTSLVTFTEEDCGSSPSSPITYTAAQPDAHQPARFVGGVPIKGLSWTPAGTGFPAGVLKATMPQGAAAPVIDAQDQIFLSDTAGRRHALVRARTPNGKPWVPMEGFNLTVGNAYGKLAGPQSIATCPAQNTPGCSWPSRCICLTTPFFSRRSCLLDPMHVLLFASPRESL